MGKKILASIFFVLFIFGLFFPTTVKAECKVITDPTIGCIDISCTTNGATYCCSDQNECYNLQLTEGPGSNPVAPTAPAPAPAAPAAPAPAAPGPAAPPAPASRGSVTIAPDPIGDLNIGEVKQSVKISGLTARTKYYLEISKRTGTTLGTGLFNEYTTFFESCLLADTNGEIEKNMGPYTLPGYYKLEITKAAESNTCAAIGTAIKSQEFSVGGPTGDSCGCGIWMYDRSRDLCVKDIDILGITSPKGPTACSKKNPRTYCEPDSLMCFKNKTVVLHGKICVYPKDPNFDPNFDKSKYAICNLGGGEQCDLGRGPAIKTAIGCINTNPAEFVKDFLKFAIAISGGFAFLMMLLGAFQMVTSAGNPDSLNAGRERLTSAIIGLLFVIFAVLLMQIIGVGFLALPEFG